ncbi:MAG: DUF3137 domain-containing protein [Bacteroidetes bacterium]|nr:DUF3137 domain-containing protein [Bacteroidota bacterium]
MNYIHKTSDRPQREIHYVTIFKGLFFIADFNKHFNGNTYVLSDFGERFLGGFGKML